MEPSHSPKPTRTGMALGQLAEVVHLDARAVQRDRLDLDANDRRLLKLPEHHVEDACLGRAILACVDHVPIVKARRQPAPLTAMLGTVQFCVEATELKS